ncbi:c-type cytochrome [Luteimonas dalianensis]|uniref:c-type cytochrome n=1 Tax=Luteimonas dalianensis TaxID=1148196 RepID=UPI003BF3A78D
MTISKHFLFLSAFSAAALLAACAPADGGSSSAGLPSGRIDAGELQAAVKGEATGQSCIDCHGADGNQPLDPTYPKIGGQYADYLGHALQQYRSGARDHSLMSNQAQGLSDQQIADLAEFFASQPSQLSDLSNAY